MTTFGLIHGASGAGVAWAPIIAALEARGHRAVAPDMPIEDPDATFADYAAAAREAVADDDAVLVGHSLGGCTIAQLPARRHVYLAAMIPQAGRRLVDVLKEEPMLCPAVATTHVRGEDRLARWADPEKAMDILFHDVDEDAGRKALGYLRGQSVNPWFHESPPLADAPSTYIVCALDRVVSPEWGREAAPRLLGAEMHELQSGHVPQLAKPRELTDLLLAAA